MIEYMSFMYYAGFITAMLVFVIGAYFLYRKFFSSSVGFSTITEGITDSQKTPEIMFFYADWCPHCKTAKPEWNKTKEYLDENKIKNNKVYCVEYDCSQKTGETEKIMNEYKIEGFPTIKLQYDNTIHDFNETPTKDNIIAFLNTIIQ